MTDVEQHELVTVAQAAEILGMRESGTFKLLDRGVLTRRGTARGRKDGTGVVDRAEVERVAADRVRAAADLEERRAEREQPKPLRTPDDAHDWLTPDEAGALIGMTGAGIRKRCHKGTIPHQKVGTFFWIRADHARLAAHVRATDGPETVAIALDRID